MSTFFDSVSLLLTCPHNSHISDTGLKVAQYTSGISVSLQGDVTGIDADVSMTAFCVIAMQESGPLCTASLTVSSSPFLLVFCFRLLGNGLFVCFVLVFFAFCKNLVGSHNKITF